MPCAVWVADQDRSRAYRGQVNPMRHWPPPPCCPEDEFVAQKGSADNSVVKERITSNVRRAPQVSKTHYKLTISIGANERLCLTSVPNSVYQNQNW